MNRCATCNGSLVPANSKAGLSTFLKRRHHRHAENSAWLGDYKAITRNSPARFPDDHFPRGGVLMVGPTAAASASCYRAPATSAAARVTSSISTALGEKVIGEKKPPGQAYMDHVIEQAVTILKHRKVSDFHHAEIAGGLAEKIQFVEAAFAGFFCGGRRWPRNMSLHRRGSAGRPHRLLSDLRKHIDGARASVPLRTQDNYSITYYCLRTARRLARREPKQDEETVAYGSWACRVDDVDEGFFMPRFLERDKPSAANRAPLRLGLASPKVARSARWRKHCGRVY